MSTKTKTTSAISRKEAKALTAFGDNALIPGYWIERTPADGGRIVATDRKTLVRSRSMPRLDVEPQASEHSVLYKSETLTTAAKIGVSYWNVDKDGKLHLHNCNGNILDQGKETTLPDYTAICDRVRQETGPSIMLSSENLKRIAALAEAYKIKGEAPVRIAYDPDNPNNAVHVTFPYSYGEDTEVFVMPCIKKP